MKTTNNHHRKLKTTVQAETVQMYKLALILEAQMIYQDYQSSHQELNLFLAKTYQEMFGMLTKHNQINMDSHLLMPFTPDVKMSTQELVCMLDLKTHMENSRVYSTQLFSNITVMMPLVISIHKKIQMIDSMLQISHLMRLL